MNSKECLEKLGNVEVAVTTIRSGITHFKTLKEQYAKEFEVLEKELLFVRDIKPFDVYEEQYKQLEKENQELKDDLKRCQDTIKKWINDNKQLIIDNGKLKKAIKLLKPLVVVKKINGGYVVNARGFEILTERAYELLKSVLEEE